MSSLKLNSEFASNIISQLIGSKFFLETRLFSLEELGKTPQSIFDSEIERVFFLNKNAPLSFSTFHFLVPRFSKSFVVEDKNQLIKIFEDLISNQSHFSLETALEIVSSSFQMFLGKMISSKKIICSYFSSPLL
jgi:hypothetical protein